MPTPKLSIITVNLNNSAGLHKTIESIVNQTFSDYEYLVIDGNSTDGSVEIIKNYESKITYWVSEPDSGIYNAMNKGIRLAKGEYCFFLNSADWLINENILSEIFNENISTDIIYFNIETEKGKFEFPKKLTFNFLFQNGICHQAMIIKSSLFKTIGLYNETFKIVSDWELICKAFLLDMKFIKINKTICFYDLNGISSDANNNAFMKREREIVLKKLIPRIYDDYIELQETQNQLQKTQNQLQKYESSKLMRFVKKIQSTSLYKKIWK